MWQSSGVVWPQLWYRRSNFGVGLSFYRRGFTDTPQILGMYGYRPWVLHSQRGEDSQLDKKMQKLFWGGGVTGISAKGSTTSQPAHAERGITNSKDQGGHILCS